MLFEAMDIGESRLARHMRRAFAPVQEFLSARLPVIEGELPPGLHGTLYRNGPGGLGPDCSPMDADGLVARFHFTPEGVDYRHRYVHTRERSEELRAGRRLFRTWSLNRPGGLLSNVLRLRFKNTANTQVVAHAGMLLALWEAGLPHLLEPESLETLGPHDFGGKLKRQGWSVERLLSPELAFSAHPRLEQRTGVLHNFGLAPGLQNQLLLYAVDAGGHMAEPRALPLERLPLVHDFALTSHYYAFLVPPLHIESLPLLLGLRAPSSCVAQEREAAAELLLVRRDTLEPLWLPAGQHFPIHCANGYEAEDGSVVMDVYCAEQPLSPNSFRDWLLGQSTTWLPPTRLVRFVAHPERRSLHWRLLSERCSEMPAIHPRVSGERHRFVWATSTSLEHPLPVHTALSKLDTDSGAELVRDLAPGMVGEPIFVPRAGAQGEDAGWLLVLVYRVEEHASELWVLRAEDLSTACRLRLPQHLPPSFHGSWQPLPSSP